MKYPDVTAGQVEAFINKLGGMEGFKRFLAGTVEIVFTKLFTKLNPINVSAPLGKPTTDCFTGSIWKYRDSDFDTWLPKIQPKWGNRPVTVVKPEKDGWTFVEFAQAVLGVTTTDVKELGDLLVKGGHTLTPEQAESLAERTEGGEATGLKTDGYANFFFVETKDKGAPVAVGNVSRSDVRRWGARVYRLGSSDRWGVDDRFLLCNADASKL